VIALTQDVFKGRHLDRRRFLGGAAGLGLGAVGLGLAACDSESDANAEATPTPPRAQGELTAARDAVLPPLSQQRTIDLTIEAVDARYEVASGVQYNAWTFGGEVPGPVVRVRQGDTINFTFENNGGMGHSMDFHAAQIDWEVNYRTITPGESLQFTFPALVPGAFMYHCGTPPVLEHIGNGMYGAIIVEPENGYPEPADREYWLVQSEFYLGQDTGGQWTGDLAKMKAATPDFMAWNGVAFQYRDVPLPAKVGERIRFYVVNAGPTLWSAFHVIGALFDTVYINGHPSNRLVGLQTHSIAPGDGAVCDVIIPNPGKYPFVSHSFAYTELGVVGVLDVTE
jgi:nitrite reductase (NO-forming)